MASFHKVRSLRASKRLFFVLIFLKARRYDAQTWRPLTTFSRTQSNLLLRLALFYECARNPDCFLRLDLGEWFLFCWESSCYSKVEQVPGQLFHLLLKYLFLALFKFQKSLHLEIFGLCLIFVWKQEELLTI